MSLESMTDTQKKLLKQLKTKGRQTEKQLKRFHKELPILVQKGLVWEKPPKGREKVPGYLLTEKGEEVARTIKITPAIRPAQIGATQFLEFQNWCKSRFDQISSEMGVLRQRIERLDPEISVVRGKFGEQSPLTPQEAVTVPKHEFAQKLRARYDFLNRSRKMGGTVPIPVLWDQLKGLGLSREIFEDYLYSLEKDRIIDLQIASDARSVSRPSDGIRHPSRGLIYYIVWRR